MVRNGTRQRFTKRVSQCVLLGDKKGCRIDLARSKSDKKEKRRAERPSYVIGKRTRLSRVAKVRVSVSGYRCQAMPLSSG